MYSDIKIEEFIFKKRFNTRGLPFAKKMWCDGYNKALDDFYTFIKMSLSEKCPISDTQPVLEADGKARE